MEATRCSGSGLYNFESGSAELGTRAPGMVGVNNTLPTPGYQSESRRVYQKVPHLGLHAEGMCSLFYCTVDFCKAFVCKDMRPVSTTEAESMVPCWCATLNEKPSYSLTMVRIFYLAGKRRLDLKVLNNCILCHTYIYIYIVCIVLDT